MPSCAPEERLERTYDLSPLILESTKMRGDLTLLELSKLTVSLIALGLLTLGAQYYNLPAEDE